MYHTSTTTETDTLDRLMSRSVVIPPLDLFEAEQPEIILTNFLERCQVLLGSNTPMFLAWLKEVLAIVGSRSSLVFYGGAVSMARGNTSSDIDAFFFSDPLTVLPIALREVASPDVVHLNLISPTGWASICSWRRFCVVGPLIAFPSPANDFLKQGIAIGRRAVLESDFFRGGIGELITYAASKIVEQKEHGYFLAGENTGSLERRIAFTKIDLMIGTLEPPAYNHEVKSTLAARLNDKEMRDLAYAALRRLRVKKERHKELATLFCEKIRARHGY